LPRSRAIGVRPEHARCPQAVRGLNVFDFLVIAAVLSAAIGGYRMGFLARVASWIGLAAGIYAAARLAPVVLDHYRGGPPETRLLVILGVILIVSTAGARRAAA
jgi:uncharacterized membrane protein required for colicin V production